MEGYLKRNVSEKCSQAHAQGGTHGVTLRRKERQKLKQINLLGAVKRRVCEYSRQSEMEQQINMKFCNKLKKKTTKTHGMLVQVYGTDAENAFTTGSNVFGKETIDEEPHLGRPSTSVTIISIERLRQILLQNR